MKRRMEIDCVDNVFGLEQKLVEMEYYQKLELNTQCDFYA